MMDPATSLPEWKASARRQAALVRAELHGKSAVEAGQAVASYGTRCLGEGQGRVIAGYHAYRTELDVTPLMRVLGASGWVTALPVIAARDAPLGFRRWAVGDDTAAGMYGIQVPVAQAEVVTPDIVLMPMLAFDGQGYRLGYGGGFYDRTIEQLRLEGRVAAIGVAFAGQQVHFVPHGCKDQALDWVLTETGPVHPVRRDVNCEGTCD